MLQVPADFEASGAAIRCCLMSHAEHHSMMHCLQWLLHERCSTIQMDKYPLCRPSQEVLDAVEGNLEDQEKVCFSWLEACMSLFPDRPLFGQVMLSLFLLTNHAAIHAHSLL